MTSTHAQTRVDTLPACGLGLAGIPLPVERDRSLPLPSSPPPAPPAFDEPEVGSRVGRYVLEQRIGEGGMGVVWRAYDVEIGRRVALKFVRTTPTGVDAKLWSRLRREAQALAKIRHDGVVSLFDMGHDGHGAYLALEYVPGMHLRRWLRQGTRSPRQILRVIAQAARGLAAVHRAGLVHRDVKPTNLLVARDGRVVWVDFGLALGVADLSRSRTDSIDDAPLRTRLTRANMIVGIIYYMSPEQLLGRDLDGRCDQFALCVTAFEALFGARPFPQESAYDLAIAYDAGTCAVLPSRPRLPRGAARALLRGLSLDPAQRFGSMDALADAIDPGDAVDAELRADAGTRADVSRSGRHGAIPRRLTPAWWRAAAIGATVALAGAAGAGWLRGRLAAPHGAAAEP
ncbi:MAG: serine/threonine protein kinase [Deltaproteobacteria bacterium]|nr:serine/threonine protein kinase [Deltaproteobacteria bacterium]